MNCQESPTFKVGEYVKIQYVSVKARDAINRRLYKNESFVETAIYRVFKSDRL
ncbi:MAG: hypothetical protein V7K68_05830 [Nostoc sp.]|uniref:hypothetical protein n=1 Tax=Nostoc sp. TaxID=1180 RepID=UPI002FFAF183